MKAVSHTEIINLSSNGENNTKCDLYVCVCVYIHTHTHTQNF